jgi:hypothetical protein
VQFANEDHEKRPPDPAQKEFFAQRARERAEQASDIFRRATIILSLVVVLVGAPLVTSWHERGDKVRYLRHELNTTQAVLCTFVSPNDARAEAERMADKGKDVPYGSICGF